MRETVVYDVNASHVHVSWTLTDHRMQTKTYSRSCFILILVTNAVVWTRCKCLLPQFSVCSTSLNCLGHHSHFVV
jgi:hypothetical protein